MRLVFLRAALVVVLAGISGLAVNSNQLYALLHKVAVQAAQDYAPRPVELPFVRDWQRQGKLMVDAREYASYTEGHIGGAYSAPAGDSQRLQALVDCCVQRAEVLVYCSSITCSDSFAVGEQLFVGGFKQVYLYEGGFADWMVQRQALVSGSSRPGDSAGSGGGDR